MGDYFTTKVFYELMRITTQLMNHQTVDIFVQLIMYAFSSGSRYSVEGGRRAET